MKTNVFLNEKVKKKGLTVKEFAGKVEISEAYAKVILAPGSKKLPSDKIGNRIVKVLEFGNEEEKEFWRLMEEDRKELEGGPEEEPAPAPEVPDLEEIKKDVKRLDLALNDCEKWIHGVEETLWKYKEENKAWGAGIEDKLKNVEKALEEIKEKQEIAGKGLWKWVWVLGLAVLGMYFIIGVMLGWFR